MSSLVKSNNNNEISHGDFKAIQTEEELKDFEEKLKSEDKFSEAVISLFLLILFNICNKSFSALKINAISLTV